VEVSREGNLVDSGLREGASSFERSRCQGLASRARSLGGENGKESKRDKEKRKGADAD
jgi:hypothetical protein